MHSTTLRYSYSLSSSTEQITKGDHDAMLFARAAQKWLEVHSMYISAKSKKCYQQCIWNLNKFFAKVPLKHIGGASIVEYQRKRLQDTVFNSKPPRKVGARMVNYECCTLAQVLKSAEIIVRYKQIPLRMTKTPGRALEPEQEKALFEKAESNPRWYVVYLAGLITNNTTAGTSEVQRLRLGDIDLKHEELHVQESVKTDFRPRVIPLNEVALWAVNKALERAHNLGAHKDEHYLFPANSKSRGKHARETHDVTKPQTTWRRAWKALVTAADLPGFRYYDLRHNPITKLCEDPLTSDETLIKIAGHRDIKMIREVYSHVRRTARRAAVERLAEAGFRPSSARPMQNSRETA